MARFHYAPPEMANITFKGVEGEQGRYNVLRSGVRIGWVCKTPNGWGAWIVDEFQAWKGTPAASGVKAPSRLLATLLLLDEAPAA